MMGRDSSKVVGFAMILPSRRSAIIDDGLGWEKRRSGFTSFSWKAFPNALAAALRRPHFGARGASALGPLHSRRPPEPDRERPFRHRTLMVRVDRQSLRNFLRRSRGLALFAWRGRPVRKLGHVAS